MSMLLFGVQEAGEHQKDVSHKSRSLQVFFMLMVLYCVQCWKQQRWTTIRYETAGMPNQENTSWLSKWSGYAKLMHSLEEREKRKAELHHIEEIRKEKKKEAKQKKDKTKKKRQGNKTAKKSEKKGLMSDLRKNLN